MNTFTGIFAKPLAFLLEGIYNIVGNYGISLIIITVIVKVCLYPLYLKQMKSMAVSSDMQRKMKQLQQKYANDKETLNIKMAELYKEEGFNPASGCLPMLIQLPIIFALFALLRNPIAYVSDTDMLFAVHESFLWINDLSQVDSWILPIVAGVSTFIAFSISMSNNKSGPNEMKGMMKIMKYAYPILIFLMGRTFPAGLALYWSFGQFMQIFFNIHMRSVRKKIIAEKEAKSKGGKK